MVRELLYNLSFRLTFFCFLSLFCTIPHYQETPRNRYPTFAIPTLFPVITGTFFNPFKSILLKNWIFTASHRVHRQTSIQAAFIYDRHFSLLADTVILSKLFCSSVVVSFPQPLTLPQLSFVSLLDINEENTWKACACMCRVGGWWWGRGRQEGRRRGGDINSLPFPSLPLVIPFDEIL